VVNDVFVTIRDFCFSGHDYIQKAIELGAVVIVCDTLENLKKNYIHTGFRQ
jgi:UDP-N-acetylmuramoyl-L-alanyl-D-glutamate--2,6-diaminopimelate ligase